jgi:flagellar M-ring protein FliF
MGAFFDRIRQWWDTADRTQKLVTVFGSAFLVILLATTFIVASKPKMQPVMTGLSEPDKASIYEELTKAGFQVNIEGNEIVVPSSDVPRAKMLLATKNKLPKSSGGGMQLIESIGIGDSQRKENEKIIAAKTQELSESIMTMPGVGSAQVHLAPGKDSPFGDQTTPPTAAIRITESNEGELSQEHGKAIARLVQNAITGMTSRGVTVVTDTGRLIYDGEEQNSTTTLASRKMEAEASESKRRAAELQRELDQVFGKGNTIVQVDVQLNMDTTSIKRDETLRTGDPIVEESAKESMSSNSSEPLEGAGAESNVPAQPTTLDPQSKASNYQNEQKSKQYPTSTTLTNIEKAAGELIAMNVTVMANQKVIEDIAPLQERISAYIAPWKGDAKFTQSVTAADFSDTADKAQAAAQAAAASSARMQQMISLLPVIALVGVALILMKSLGSAIKKSANQTLVLSNGEKITIPLNTDPKLLALLESASRPVAVASLPNLEEEYEEVVEESVDENGETVVTKTRRKKKNMYEEDELDDPDIESIERKIDVPLEQIRKMARNNPEAVSMLLKSWMMEEAK